MAGALQAFVDNSISKTINFHEGATEEDVATAYMLSWELGGGLGLNYFFTRNLGVGAEAYSENTTGTFIDNASGNLILRLPLGQCGFAPYIFGGGGHQFDAAKLWFGQGGAGLEYRFTPHIGMFLDARMVWPNETKYYGVARLGVRFAF